MNLKVGDLVLVYMDGDGHYDNDDQMEEGPFSGVEYKVFYDKNAIKIPHCVTAVMGDRFEYKNINTSQNEITKIWRHQKDDSYKVIYDETEKKREERLLESLDLN